MKKRKEYGVRCINLYKYRNKNQSTINGGMKSGGAEKSTLIEK